MEGNLGPYQVRVSVELVDPDFDLHLDPDPNLDAGTDSNLDSDVDSYLKHGLQTRLGFGPCIALLVPMTCCT